MTALLDGHLISHAVPNDGDVMTWDAAARCWRPVQPTTPVVPPTTDQDIYIDGVSGSDNNDGLLKTTPLATISGYYTRYGSTLPLGARRRLHLAGVGGADPWITPTTPQTYAEDRIVFPDSALVPNALVIRGPTNMVRATLATGPATAVMDAVPAQIVDETGAANPAGRRTEILCVGAAPGWTPQDMGPSQKGCYLRITRAGVKRFFEIPIADNTANSIIVDCLTIVGNVLAADTMEIVIPGAVIEGATDLGGGAKFTALGGYAGTPGTLTTPPVAASQGSSFERVSLSVFTLPGASLSFDRCRFTPMCYVSTASVNFMNCTTVGVKVEVAQNGAVRELAASRPDTAADPAVVTAYVMLMARFIEVRYSGCFIAKGTVSCYYAGAADNGLSATDGGLFRTESDLLGDGAAGHGIGVNKGGRVQIPGGANTTLTGALGDLTLAGATVAYGNGAGQFEEAAGINGNWHNTTIIAGVPQGDFSRIYKG